MNYHRPHYARFNGSNRRNAPNFKAMIRNLFRGVFSSVHFVPFLPSLFFLSFSGVTREGIREGLTAPGDTIQPGNNTRMRFNFLRPN